MNNRVKTEVAIRVRGLKVESGIEFYQNNFMSIFLDL